MALWIRNLKELGVKLEWHGGSRILITADKDGVIDVAETEHGKTDFSSIGELMNKVENNLYKIAVAMG